MLENLENLKKVKSIYIYTTSMKNMALLVLQGLILEKKIELQQLR